jgi:hypothetical protein
MGIKGVHAIASRYPDIDKHLADLLGYIQVYVDQIGSSADGSKFTDDVFSKPCLTFFSTLQVYESYGRSLKIY